jgi:hypothetical protein
MRTEFSDDPNTLLNVMIKGAWDISHQELGEIPNKDFIAKIREIYEIGFDEGEQFVWKVRSGDFKNDEKTSDLKGSITTTNDTKDMLVIDMEKENNYGKTN